MALAALTSVIWGLAFVATKVGLESFSAPQLTALRFLVAALPVLFLARPPVSWTMLILIGLTLFTGQFLLLFFAFSLGMPPGLASVTQQTQAFFTVLLAAVFLGDVPARRQILGMVVAFGGLGLVALSVGGELPAVALFLAIASAFSWAVGNVLVKRVGPVPMLPFMAWLSLVPPLPALIVASFVPGPSILEAIATASLSSLAGTLYLGAVATGLAYAIWGGLLARYPAASIAPFALLAPCAGVVASVIAFGEPFSPERLAGMSLIVAGLAVIVVPASWFKSHRETARAP
jgi:O-acetylserine/cysteine efflux transporter